MRVRIERRGGQLGRMIAGERKLDELTPAQRRALSTVEAAPKPSVPSPGYDRFRYRVILTDKSGTRAFDVSEDDMPDELASIPQLTL